MKLILLFCCGLFSQVAHAEVANLTAVQWLDKMQQAMKTQDFRGTVLFMKRGQLDSMKYHHSVKDGLEQERLIALNSPMREVVRKSNEVTCLYKETSQKVINHHPLDSSFIVNFPPNMASLETHYQLESQGQEPVAMLPTQIISIRPKDDMRYARKIWIQTQLFLPLKVETYGDDGSVVEQVVFTDLSFDASSELPKSAVNEKEIHTQHINASQAEPLDNAKFVLKHWPAGFEPVYFIRNSIEKSDKAVDHLMLSDGFSTVSVYLESKENDGVTGGHTLGSVNSFSKVINDQQITVLGEVPAKTVEYIAAGIHLR